MSFRVPCCMLHAHYKTVTVPELGISNFTFHTSHNGSLISATGMDNIVVPFTVPSSHRTFSRRADVNEHRIYVTGVNFEPQLNLHNYRYLVSHSQKTMGTGSFRGVKRPGRGVDHPPPSSADVKERVRVYISPSGPSWPVLG